jgi:hypothetical protein
MTSSVQEVPKERSVENRQVGKDKVVGPEKIHIAQ